MDIQKILTSPAVSGAMMRYLPPSFFERIGEKRALKTFRRAAKEVPAYAMFLEEHGINAADIRTLDDFRTRVPIMDKAAYLMRYPLADRVSGGSFRDRSFTVFSSSGSSGHVTYWPQESIELERMVGIVGGLIADMFHLRYKHTLVVNTLALGMWSAGRSVLRLFDDVAEDKKRYKVVSVTPGLNLEDALGAIRDLGPLFEQVLLCGYPPFLKKLMDEGERRGLDWKRYNISFVMGGELVSESLREDFAEKAGFSFDAGSLERVWSLYASSDGIVTPETRLSIAIRRVAAENPRLAEALFGTVAPLPSLVQCAPMNAYLEPHEDGFLFTRWSSVPVIRYDIHDRGGIIPFTRALEIIGDFGLTPKTLADTFGYADMPLQPFPFLYVFGRQDALKVAGANVFVDHVAAALEDERIRDLVTGLFTMEKRGAGEAHGRLVIRVEIRKDYEPDTAMETRIGRTLVDALASINSEFRSAISGNPEEATPVVELVRQGDDVFLGGNIKNKFLIAQK